MAAAAFFGSGGKPAASALERLRGRTGGIPPSSPASSSSLLQQCVPIDADEAAPRDKLRASAFGCGKRKRAAAGGVLPFGTCGEPEPVKEREAKSAAAQPGGGRESAAERRRKKICGPFVEKAEKRDERTGKRKIVSFAAPEAVFAAVKDPEKDIDPATETGAASRKNILAWLRVYSDDAAERTRRSNDAALFKGGGGGAPS